jgi:hypothetical protein
MMQATVTIAYLDPPTREGAKNWKLKDKAGVSYSTPALMAQSLQVGQTVVIDYKEKEYQGKKFNMVEYVGPANGPAPAPMPAAAPRLDHRDFHGTPVPAPKPSNGPPSQDKHIFVTGTVGRAMGSGKFDPQDIRVLTEFACAAWDEFFR